MATDDPNWRIQQLSQKLLDKEHELAACQTSQTFLKQELESANAELTAAREELRNEATKNSLLEQRLRRITDEVQQTRNELANSLSECDNLNRTLNRVHDQLNKFRSESTAKGIQLTELQLHYDSLLATKEESIRSLQALLDGQQKQLLEQQAVWEEEKRTLKAGLADATTSGHRAAAGQALAQAQAVGVAVQSAALADLRAKLAAAEATALKAASREHKLVEMLRHREKQVVKLKQKRNSQGGRNTNGVAAGGGAKVRDTGERDRGVVFVGGADSAAGGGGGGGGSGAARLPGGKGMFVGGISSDEDSLFADTATSLELSGTSPLRHPVTTKGSFPARESPGNCRSAVLQAALQDERRRHEAVRSRLMVSEQEADDLRLQVSRLKAELLDTAPGGPVGSDVQLADELLRAHRTIQVTRNQYTSKELEAQLRRTRDGLVTPTPGSTASVSPPASSSQTLRGGGARGGGPGLLTVTEHLVIVRQRLLRQRLEFEQLLERVLLADADLMRGVPSGVLLPEDVKGFLDRHLSRIDVLASIPGLPEARQPGPADHEGAGVGVSSGGVLRAGGQHPHQQHQHQHSLFVVRAAWSTLRRALISLQEAVASSLDVSANPAVAYLQGADFLSRIMREWVVGEKVALDTAVEASMSAAVALVQEAAGRLQAHALDAGVVRQQLQEAQDEVAKLRLTNSMVQAEGDRHLAERRVEVEELRRAIELARSEASALQAEAAVRLSELETARARADAAEVAAQRAEVAAAAAELERSRLRKNLAMLEGDKGNSDALAQSWEEERVRLTRALSDANATIALLHDRLEAHQAAGNSQMVALKQRIRDVVTTLESPSLPQLHAMMVAAAADGDGAAAADGADLAAAAVAGVGPARNVANNTPRRGAARRGGGGGLGNVGVLSEISLNTFALGMHAVSGSGAITAGAAAATAGADDPIAVSGSLVAALDFAAVSCSAALHRMALLEMAHQEVDRGVAAVAAVRSHLASATAEMAAGRVSFGDVLLTELLSMLDEATSNPTTSSSSAMVAAPGPSPARGSQTPRARSANSSAWHQLSGATGGAMALRAQLATARDQTQNLMRHLKNMEGLILALKSALPEWLELATARLAARHRTELSRLRGVLGGQLATLRRGLREMKSSCHATMAEAAAQAEETLQQARRMAAAADEDRNEANMHLNHLSEGLQNLTDTLAAITATTTAAAAGGGGSVMNTPSSLAAANSTAAAPEMGPIRITPTMAAAGAAAPSPARVDGVTAAAGEMLPGGRAYSLVRSVASATRMISELRTSCEKIRRDAVALVSERDVARAAASAASASTNMVVKSVAEAVPLPEVLIMGLLLTAPEQVLTPFWCVKLRECVAAQMGALQAAAVDGVVKGQVEPMRRKMEKLNDELKASKRRVALLQPQAQAASFMEESGTALESCRRAAGEAAAAVLDSVMAGVREEVTAVRMQVSDLETGSTDVLRKANAAWSDQLAAVRASSSAAVVALEESVAVLQAQLGNEADAYDRLRAESDAAVKEATERIAVEQQRIRSLHADLAIAKERLAALEAAETTLEGENRGLRKALRQREMLAMGLMQQQQQHEEDERQPQPQQQQQPTHTQQQQQQRPRQAVAFVRSVVRESGGG
ncbi:hypothetical protein VaNZ11_003391 [Volvox africanus]|uniref:Uncharacterized protein n=1 Tax=Volvox africanus TaxID=51714 RepID=A0ABQ5RV15_9CHLO|nr:hypothetical protein VaNZ11_003391 [Volvox africanus]